MREIQLPFLKKSVIEKCKSVLMACEFEIEKEDSSFITEIANSSFFSYGNRIKLTFRETRNSTTVNIESASVAKFQIIDWGTNSALEDIDYCSHASKDKIQTIAVFCWYAF